MLMTKVLSPWKLTPSHLIGEEIPKIPFHCLIFLLPLTSLGRCLLYTENTVVGLEYNPVNKVSFLFSSLPQTFRSQKFKSQQLIQPFHKQFATTQFVQTDQVSRPWLSSIIVSPRFHVSASLAAFHFLCLSSLKSGEHAKSHSYTHLSTFQQPFQISSRNLNITQEVCSLFLSRLHKIKKDAEVILLSSQQ